MANSIEVLLREHVADLGRCGDVVKVAPGYARNFLMPRKLAVAATEENKKQIARRAARLAAEEEKILAELDAEQGQKTDLGGYYHHDPAKTQSIMRPSATLNNIL